MDLDLPDQRSGNDVLDQMSEETGELQQ